ncbi:FAD-binding oxidoreductase [Rhodococcus aetherivorans]
MTATPTREAPSGSRGFDRALADLEAAVGSALVLDREVIAAYSHDQAQFCVPGTAAALVRARSRDDVVAVMHLAHEHRVPVVIQGTRTGVSGAAIASDGCILLSLERMNRILEIDPVERVAVVQPGVVNADLSRAVAEHGLFYPPDPGSWESSSIGGNVATNAGGMCCVKYGVTADYVRGLEFVVPGGTVHRSGRRTAKGVAGYDLTHLLVGSEGTLAAVTEIVLSLVPAAGPQLTAVGVFDNLSSAARAVARIMSNGPAPAMLELIDRPSIVGVNDYAGLGLPEAAALLLVQTDVGRHAAEDLDDFVAALAAEGATDTVVAADEAESKLLVEARRLLAPAMMARGTLLIEDVCVPIQRLAELVEGVAEIGRRRRIVTICPGHAGDGNLHPAVLFDAGDEQQVAAARAAFDDIMALGLQLGGTVTGEHGVGTLKRDWLRTELGSELLELQRAVKRAFDPYQILNPGKVF